MNNNNMYWQNNQRQQFPPQYGHPQEMFIVRSVGSREEAVATPVDYFKPTIILGVNHDMVYIKRFNTETGTTEFFPYKYCPDAAVQPKYVTEEQFEEFKAQIMQGFSLLKGNRQEAMNE